MSFIVIGVDGDEETALIKRELASDQCPGGLDRFFLEVVAKRKITQHLKEGVVPRRVADIIEIVVLAARPNALLRRGRPGIGTRFSAGEDILERHHARIDEKQGRVVLWNERRGGGDRVPTPREVVEEGRANFVQARHGRSVAGSAVFRDRLIENHRLANQPFEAKPGTMPRPWVFGLARSQKSPLEEHLRPTGLPFGGPNGPDRTGINPRDPALHRALANPKDVQRPFGYFFERRLLSQRPFPDFS